MLKHPALRHLSRPFVLTLMVATLSALAACGGNPPEFEVRTNTASGSWLAPSGAEAANRDRALVRVVFAIPGASRLDLFADRQKIADGLEYKVITPYLEVPAGRQALRLRPAGLDTADPLSEETENLRAGQYYTVVVMPGEEGRAAAALRIFHDPMEVPEEGRATMRIVHAAADAGRIDVYVPARAEPLATGLDFQDASSFSELQPSSSPIELRPADRSETMLRVADVRPSGGGIYTVVVIGRTRIEPPLETLVLEDRVAGPQTR